MSQDDLDLSPLSGQSAAVTGGGGNHPQSTTSDELSVFDLSIEAFRKVFELNCLGVILPRQVLGKPIVETVAESSGRGSIANINSMNAPRPLTRIPAYSAAKAAVSNFTQWLAVHMARDYTPRIRVNAMAPGFFLTERNRYLLIGRESGALGAATGTNNMEGMNGGS